MNLLNTTHVTPVAAPLSALTSLRFIAAFAVLLLHYRDLLGHMPAWLMRGLVGGQYGVTFFFILSGFILTYRYKNWFANGVNTSDYWNFQRLRLARIYPIYVLGLLLDTPWHILERLDSGQLQASGQLYWASWLLNLVGLQAWVPAIPYAMFWNTPAWSVSAEFFFYATFPFVCRFAARHSNSKIRLLFMWGASILSGIALYGLVIYGLTYVTRVGGETQYIILVYNPLLRFSEFFAGCLAGQYFLGQSATNGESAKFFQSRTARDMAVVLCLVLIAVRVWMPDYHGPNRWWWLADVSAKYGIFILPFTVLILALASGRTSLSWLLERPVLILLGEASYALYIIHWSVTTFLRMGYLGSYGTPAMHILFLLATVGASVLCYLYIEVPCRQRLRGALIQ
jgi:peptidoglycan/LPS O-acetylase OafA/YrhL